MIGIAEDAMQIPLFSDLSSSTMMIFSYCRLQGGVNRYYLQNIVTGCQGFYKYANALCAWDGNYSALIFIYQPYSIERFILL